MRKNTMSVCIIGSLMILLDTVNFGQDLLLLLFAGVVPGTNIVISPIDMMAAIATAITVLLLRITVWPSLKPIVLGANQSKKPFRRVA